jgi:F-type H+-transporting ATPase subunit b
LEIDWFTFIAQIINFVLLVALLKIFLYGPIIRSMDKREEKIASRWNEAEEKKKESEEEAADYREKKEDLEKKRQEIMSEARAGAEKLKKELTKKVREEVDELDQRWRESIQKDKENFLKEVRRQVVEQVLTISRHAFHDLADKDLEGQIIRSFIEQVKEIGEEEKEELMKSIEEDNNRATVLSAFEIPEDLREEVVKTLQEQFSEDLELEFKTSMEVICGMELKSYGHKIAWSLDDYLDDLEESLAAAFEERARSEEQKEKE